MDDSVLRNEIDPYVGFGSAEMAYLLAQLPGDVRAARVAEVIGIDPREVEEVVLAAGASSLLARGLLALEDDALVTRDDASVLTSAIANADVVVGVGFMITEDVFSDGLVLLQCAGLSLILQPRALGTWFALVRAPQISDGDAIAIMARAFLAEHAKGQVLLTVGEQAALLTRDDVAWHVTPDVAGLSGGISDDELGNVLDRLIDTPITSELD